MIEFIQLLFIGCLWIWGINYLFKKGEILGFIGEYLRAHVSKWFLKPLFNCPVCQSSVHGTLIYFSAVYLNYFAATGCYWLLFWPFYCICIVGLNHIITALIYDLE